MTSELHVRCRQICYAEFSGDRFGARHVPRRKHLRERSRAEEQTRVLWHVANHVAANVSFTAIKWDESYGEGEEC